jgi:hypothetical protein
VNLVSSARTYWRYAALLSRHWERSFAITAAKLVASRVRYGRGPQEFDKFRFTDKPLREWREYVRDDELFALQEGTAPMAFRRLDDDKLAFARHCGLSGLPTASIVAVLARASGGSDEVGDFRTVTSADELALVLRSEGDFDGFAKPRGAGQGYGAFGFTVRAGTVRTPEGAGTAQDLFAQCMESPFANAGCYLLQRRILPHTALTGIMPGPGLGTVRILTCRHRSGEVEIPWAVLKVPAPGADADNLRFGSLACAVEMQTGALGVAVGRTPERPVVHPVEKHPTTGVTFASVAVPHWPAAIALVTRAAKAFEMLPVLGWDVAIAPDGPLLVEANRNFAMALSEIAQGRGLARETRRLWARLAGVPA